MRINLTKKEIVNSIYMQIGFSKKISENINKQLPIVNIEQGELIFKFLEKKKIKFVQNIALQNKNKKDQNLKEEEEEEKS